MPDNIKKILVIAGYDPSGGAGILVDLKTIHSLGAYALCVPTCITIQNTQRVYEVYKIEKEVIAKNLEAIISDCEIHGVKIGVLYSKEIIFIVYDFLKRNKLKNIVLDPVIKASSGAPLIEDSALSSLKELISLCDIVTPNIPEAEILTGIKIKTIEDMKNSAKIIKNWGVKGVVIKGGHLEEEALDLLFWDQFYFLKGEKLKKDVHGTGCIFSSVLTTFLAMGDDYYTSFVKAKEYIKKALKNTIKIGRGREIYNP